MDVLTPRSLEEALDLKAAHPGALPIQGGTDVMVALNFDRARPDVLLNLNEVAELRGWSRENGTVRLGAGLTYTEAMSGVLAGELPALAEASRTVGSPQIRNRGTIGGNLGTASPAGDALPPLLVDEAVIELASVRGTRRVPLEEFLVGVKRNALEADELIVAAQPARAATDVHEGRPTECDGHRRVLTRGRGRSRAGRAAGRVRVVRADRASRSVTDRRSEHLPGAGRRSSKSDRRRARYGRLPTARPPCADRACAREVPCVRVELTVNGETRETDVWGGESLLTTLRDRLELPGSKNACEQGECGSCSVLLDGELVCSCLVLAAQADGHDVVTVEGLSADGELHPVQEAFADAGAVQCGFCTPGFVVAAADLLRRVPDPSDDEIREALSGNLCRCTGYQKILDAVHQAAGR